MHSLRQYILQTIGLLIISFTFLTCTKTEYIDYEPEAHNRILSYRVTNSTQEIFGVIDNDDNTVTVYLPYYTGISFLDVEIKVDEGAILLDSLGKTINLDGGLEPVSVGDTVKYMVESSSGERRTYTVVQKIVAHSDPLTVTYVASLNESGILEKPVHSVLTLSGNFESIGTHAKFYFKDKSTGVVYDDFVSVQSVEPSTPQYIMTLHILPTALAGQYEVTMEHQGRRATLPDIHLRYSIGIHGFFLSTTQFAPGEEIVFTAIGYQDNDAYNGIYTGLERIYIKLDKDHLYEVPGGFPEELYGQKIPLEIISWNRSEIRAKFPTLPKGVYKGSYQWGSIFPNIGYIGFGFYFDFDEQSGWGKDVLLAGPSSYIEVL